MTEIKPDLSKGQSSETRPSSNKSEAETRREKKRKMAAFKTFLNHVEPEQQPDPLFKRRLSGQLTEEKLQSDPQCKICKVAFGEKGKECMFCHDVVCPTHFRKKRRDANSRFARICDSCEDTYIYKRYLKNQMKVQETLVAQELLLEVKFNELQESLNGKRAKLAVLKNKAEELETLKNKQQQKHATQKAEVQQKLKKLQQRRCDVAKLQKQLTAMQKKLPASLQVDYQVLVQQNDKITKELVKYQKWCNDVIKARSIREKKMYEDYYQWQQMEKNKRHLDKKEEECDIY